jgi:LPXTG-motif cell wall-anchored protein
VCSLSISGSQSPNSNSSHIVIHGQDFPPNTDVDIVLDGTTVLGTAHINNGGNFNEQVELPSGLAPGQHVISVGCATTGVDSTVTVGVLGTSVTAAPTPTTTSIAGAPLARTGSDSKPVVVFGLGAIAIGAGFVLAARRRRTAA